MNSPSNVSEVGLYLGWVGHHNLGDEAMWHHCNQRYRHLNWWPVGSGPLVYYMESVGQTMGWPVNEVPMLGGGTLINANVAWLKRYRELRLRTKRPAAVFGSGVQDPHFWRGRVPQGDLRADWCAYLEELPVVGVRGPLSKELLEAKGLRNVIVSGDPAVAFHSPILQPRPRRNAKSIVVNFGVVGRAMFGDLAEYESKLGDAIAIWTAEGHRIKVCAVWPEDLPACEHLVKQAGLPSDALAPLLTNHQEYLDFVRRADVLIAFKLHAAVLGAAANVPMVIVEYRPKCRDFAAAIGWEQFTLRPDLLTSRQLVDVCMEVSARQSELEMQISAQMTAAKAAFERYCVTIAPLLGSDV